jgi:hypothetical protein
MLYDAGARAFDTPPRFPRRPAVAQGPRARPDGRRSHEKRVTLKSITEPFDTANAAGKDDAPDACVFAEFEHATIVERTKVGMEKKAKGGKFVGATFLTATA